MTSNFIINPWIYLALIPINFVPGYLLYFYDLESLIFYTIIFILLGYLYIKKIIGLFDMLILMAVFLIDKLGYGINILLSSLLLIVAFFISKNKH